MGDSSEPGRGFVTTTVLSEAAEGTAQIDSASRYGPTPARHAESICVLRSGVGPASSPRHNRLLAGVGIPGGPLIGDG